MHALFLYGGKASPSSHTSGAATAGCSSSLQRLAGGEAAFSVSLSSCCSAFGSAGSEAGGLAESSTGCEACRDGELSRFRPPWPKPVGNGGARGGSFSAGFEGAFAAAVFASAAAFGEELEDSSADFDSALPSSRASSGSSHFTFCIGKPGGSSSLAGRASADSSGFFSPGGRSAGLVLESSRSRLRDGDELARLLCRASRLLVLLLRRRWPWRCAGGAGTCGTVATGYICIAGEVLTK